MTAAIVNAHDVPHGNDALLLTDVQAADLLAVSRSHFRNMVRLGNTPEPVRLGRLARWRRFELEDWINAAMPPRHKWRWTKPRSRVGSD